MAAAAAAAAKSSGSRLPESESAPWLLYIHGKHPTSAVYKSQTFYSLTEGRIYIRSIKELQNKNLCPTSQGWLLVCDRSSNYTCLLNPATKAEIQLPSISGDDVPIRCVLSLPPSDPDCIVMFLEWDKESIFFCHPGDDAWNKRSSIQDNGHHINGITFCNGKFYAKTPNWDLYAIDLDSPHSRELISKGEPTLWPQLCCSYQFFLESRGEVFNVVKYFRYLRSLRTPLICVYKMNFSKKEWDLVYDIGDDRVFFIDDKNSMSWSASKLRIKGNCTYYTMKDDKSFYVYDMDEGTLSVRNPCQNLPNPWKPPIWVMPTAP